MSNMDARLQPYLPDRYIMNFAQIKELGLPNRTSETSLQWLTCVATLPTIEPASRMRVLRMLDSLGCAVIRDGVYLLPDTASNRNSLSRLCDHITRAGGSAFTLLVTAIDDNQAQQFKQQFDRTAKYESLIATILGLRIGFGVSDAAAISKVLSKQKRELEAIATLDFFPSTSKARAIQVFADAEMEVRTLMFPTGAATSASATQAKRYLNRVWATRLPLWADRLASAWLIRRFIDTEAKLIWLEKSQSAPQTAVSFGFEGAEFSNNQTEITYERLMKAFVLQGKAPLKRIALLVHQLEAGGTPVAEAAGVENLLQGARRRAVNEDDLFAECEKTFNLLYDAYAESA